MDPSACLVSWDKKEVPTMAFDSIIDSRIEIFVEQKGDGGERKLLLRGEERCSVD